MPILLHVSPNIMVIGADRKFCTAAKQSRTDGRYLVYGIWYVYNLRMGLWDGKKFPLGGHRLKGKV